jgi:hypothetical protein
MADKIEAEVKGTGTRAITASARMLQEDSVRALALDLAVISSNTAPGTLSAYNEVTKGILSRAQAFHDFIVKKSPA